MTKKLLLILITLMAYLPLTVSYAMPDVSVPEQYQAVMTMDMSNCHDQQLNKKCGHCSDDHNCNSSHSSCSTSSVIATQAYRLGVEHDNKGQYMTFNVSTLFQQPIPLFRPPISL